MELYLNEPVVPLPILHLVGRFDDPHAGADRTLLEIGAALADVREVRFWADGAVHPFFQARGVVAVSPVASLFPQDGMLLLAGIHIRLGDWLRQAQLYRVALRYNLPDHGALFAMIESLREACGLEPEIFFVSPALQAAVNLPGIIEPSLIDIAPFLKIFRRADRGVITVGRLSRDVIEKHHPLDVSLYKMLAAQGIQMRVMGGTCLRESLGDTPGVELIEAGAESQTEFLQSLDIFLYRTGSMYEAYGRIIFEAMASGMPVVASAHGGYAAWVAEDSGVTLFTTQEQAFNAVLALSASKPLREALGQRARAKAIDLHGPAAKKTVLAHYLH